MTVRWRPSKPFIDHAEGAVSCKRLRLASTGRGCSSRAGDAPVSRERLLGEALAVELRAPLAVAVLVNVAGLVSGGHDQPFAPVGVGEEREPIAGSNLV